MVLYGVVVIGPPGSGKSTLCAGLARYFELMKRPCAVVNLDPACEEEGLTPFSIDVRNLCRVDDIMGQHKLGANGSLMYCVSMMSRSPWLYDRLRSLGDSDGSFPYLLFDMPGQVELWTHSDDLRLMLETIVRELDARLVVAHVVDSNHCTLPSSFIAASLISLMAMLRLELPHINVLSKVDQLPRFRDAMPFNLDYFAESRQLDRLVPFCLFDNGGVPQLGDLEVPDAESDVDGEPPTPTGLQRLSAKIGELVEDFNLVCYQPLDISDGTSVAQLVRMLDKANAHPAAIYAPAQLVENATRIFLGKERTDLLLNQAPRVACLDDRTFRTHVDPNEKLESGKEDCSTQPEEKGDGVDFEPFSWYRRGSLLSRTHR